jgi:hypothetical protein
MAARLSTSLARLTRIRTPKTLARIPPHSCTKPAGTYIRSMANSSAATTAAPRKYEWLVVIPDIPGTLEKRLAVRP